MDEYLFIEMAKLKADREKLARAQQAQKRAERDEQRSPERTRDTIVPVLAPLVSWR